MLLDAVKVLVSTGVARGLLFLGVGDGEVICDNELVVFGCAIDGPIARFVAGCTSQATTAGIDCRRCADAVQ